MLISGGRNYGILGYLNVTLKQKRKSITSHSDARKNTWGSQTSLSCSQIFWEQKMATLLVKQSSVLYWPCPVHFLSLQHLYRKLNIQWLSSRTYDHLIRNPQRSQILLVLLVTDETKSTLFRSFLREVCDDFPQWVTVLFWLRKQIGRMCVWSWNFSGCRVCWSWTESIYCSSLSCREDIEKECYIWQIRTEPTDLYDKSILSAVFHVIHKT